MSVGMRTSRRRGSWRGSWREDWRAALTGAALAAALHVLPAQAAAQTIVDLDQAIGRARTLVESGNGRAGRLVLDSLVQQAPSGSAALGELLYWRGLLSESSAEAERDWRRLILEVSISPRVEDATLRLAQLALLRGRPADSRVLLERLARDYPDPASQARAHFWLAKAWFDENDRPRACGALDVARRDAPASAVELRTQVDDLRGQCRGVQSVSPIAVAAAPTPVTPAAPVDTTRARTDTVGAAQTDTTRMAQTDTTRTAVARADTARVANVVRDTSRVDTTRTAPPRETPVNTPPVTRETPPPTRSAPPATTPPPARNTPPATSTTTRPANARFSVQLAAYTRLDQAQALVRQLAARDIDARVDGTAAPFRVRTGYFATRAQAATRLTELKARGHDGFVAELTP